MPLYCRDITSMSAGSVCARARDALAVPLRWRIVKGLAVKEEEEDVDAHPAVYRLWAWNNYHR